mgnify:CR=1 FL=1
MKANKNIKTLAQFKDEHYGKVGTAKRDKLDKGFEAFKLGALIQEARLEQGLTQEQLADKCGTNKPIFQGLKTTLKTFAFRHCKKLLNSVSVDNCNYQSNFRTIKRRLTWGFAIYWQTW